MIKGLEAILGDEGWRNLPMTEKQEEWAIFNLGEKTLDLFKRSGATRGDMSDIISEFIEIEKLERVKREELDALAEYEYSEFLNDNW